MTMDFRTTSNKKLQLKIKAFCGPYPLPSLTVDQILDESCS